MLVFHKMLIIIITFEASTKAVCIKCVDAMIFVLNLNTFSSINIHRTSLNNNNNPNATYQLEVNSGSDNSIETCSLHREYNVSLKWRSCDCLGIPKDEHNNSISSNVTFDNENSVDIRKESGLEKVRWNALKLFFF